MISIKKSLDIDPPGYGYPYLRMNTIFAINGL